MIDEGWIRAAETLPIIVWTARPDGRVEYINRRWIEATGIPASKILDDGWTSVIHVDDVDAAAEAYRRALADGTPLSVEVRIRFFDGSYRWVRAQSEPMFDENGAIVRWFGVVIDVDELHRADERFRVVGDATPVIIWSADAEGWIDWYNHRWYAYTGQTFEEARGWGWQAAHNAEDFPEVMRRWPESIATGKPFEMEFRLRRHDGVFHWFLTRAEPLLDENGKVLRWYGSNIDIDAQKNALERTRRIAETLQNVFLPSTLPDYEDLRIDAAYIAAERDALVGGDWYDAYELPDGRIAFSVGDVAGHGLTASVLVGRMRQTVHTLALKGADPAQILTDTNAVLQHQDPDTFVTAIVGFISAAHDSITYANAGHPPPVLAAGGDTAEIILPPSGIPLGVSADAKYTNERLAIGPETLFVLYTDGMTEYMRQIEAAERKLLAAAALVARDTSLAHPARAVQELVLDGHPVTDDAAVMTIQISAFAQMKHARSKAPIQRVWRFHSSDAYSAHASRVEIISYLRPFCAENCDIFPAELIVGELLANTVEHAPGLVEIDLSWNGDFPVMTVRDSGPGMHRISHELPADPLDENGRGLFLIKQLANDLRVSASPGFGTEIRVNLPMSKRRPDRSDARHDTAL